MKNGTKLMLAAGLLCGTAVPAMAQTPNQNASDQACERLQIIVNDYEDRFRAEWIENANAAIGEAGRSECARYVAQADQAIEELERRDQLAQQQGEAQTGQQQGQAQTGQQAQADTDQSRIIVDQPEPRVTVQQDAPRITYSQPQAQVDVSQGTPEIIVRQAQPTVRIEMPRPTITIDQPEPEIIVRMPEPDVNVNVPEPEFNVSQSQPEVRVEQERPQVQVEMDQPEVNVQQQGRAEVQIQRDQPVVQREGGEQQAVVNVERAEPRVRYERAEPRVEFEQTGEPQVTFNRTGEPNVRVERQGEQAAGQETGRQGETERTALRQNQEAEGGEQVNNQSSAMHDQEQTASVNPDQMPDEAVQRLRGDAQAEGQPVSIRVSEIVDRDVVNLRGEELGTVERVVLDGERIYIVLSHGGFLGMGDREVALPLDRIAAIRGDDELVLQGLSEEDIEAMPRWDGNAGRELEGGQEIRIAESS